MGEIFEYTVTVNENEIETLEEKLLLHGMTRFCFDKKGEEVLLRLYLTDREDLPDFLDTRFLKVRKLEPSDWLDRVEEFQQPFELVDGVIVDPGDSPVEGAKIVLKISPGLAFGTGRHVTTKMAAQLLCRVMKPMMSVLDLGCGTGILAILAARLGAGRVVAVDNDPLAVQKAREEVERNQVNVDVVLSNAFEKVRGMYDIVVSNIHVEVLLGVMVEARRFLRAGGYLILSGILKKKSFKIDSTAREHGYEILGRLEGGEWCAMLLRNR